MEEKNIKDNLSVGENWIRGLYMVLFLIAYSVSETILAVIVIIQFIFKVTTNSLNEQLKKFSFKMNLYVFQILQFVTYQTEEKPFPFMEFPDAENTEANS